MIACSIDLILVLRHRWIRIRARAGARPAGRPQHRRDDRLGALAVGRRGRGADGRQGAPEAVDEPATPDAETVFPPLSL